MELLIVKDYEELSKKAAKKVIEVAVSGYEVNICIPTGRTPVRMFELLVDYSKEKPGVFDSVRWFTLDEYINIPLHSEKTCWTKLNTLFYKPAGISKERTFTFNSAAKDYNEEAARYEQQLNAFGGLDLVVLGIGRNGHVGFNEPGSQLSSPTRVMELQKTTLEQSRNYFDLDEKLPDEGITLGIKTLLNSREILLFANGKEKEDIIQKVVEEEVTSELPASYFKEIPSLLIIDEEAAGKLAARR